MTGKSHVLCTALLSLVIPTFTPLSLPWQGIFIVVSIASARVPDQIEIWKSLFGHRTWSHLILTPLVFGALLYSTAPQLPPLLVAGLSGLIFGYTTHLLLDAFSIRGIPFIPRVPLYSTGKFSEFIFVFLIAIGCAYQLLSYYLPNTIPSFATI